MNKLMITADVATLQKSDLFMGIKCVLFVANEFNLNDCAVTENFIDEIVNNKNKYIGLPLYADVNSLKNGGKLTHMYNERTGTFGSTQIGSFVDFEKTTNENGNACLIGYANCPKRNDEILAAVSELFTNESLKFSFEIAVGDLTEDDEGRVIIDYVPHKNFLEGMSVVSIPACPDAVALDFVAEKKDNSEEAQQMVEQENVIAEQVISEVNTDAAENTVATEATVSEASEHEEVLAEESTPATEEIVVEEITTPTETAEETAEADEVETAQCGKPNDEKGEEAECCKKSEEENAGCCKKSEDEDAECCKKSEDEEAECCKKAEEETASCGVNKSEDCEECEREDIDEESEIIRLRNRIKELEAKVAELTAAALVSSTSIISEVIENNNETINPFMSDGIGIEDASYRLLESEVQTRESWTLI